MPIYRSQSWPRGVLAALLALTLLLGTLVPGSAASRPAASALLRAHHPGALAPGVNTTLYGLSIPYNDGSGTIPPPPGWQFVPFSTWAQIGATWVRLEIDTVPLNGTLDSHKAVVYYQNMLHNLHAAGLKVMALVDYETLPNDYDTLHQLYPWQCFLQLKPSVDCLGFIGTPQEYENDFARQASILANLGADAPDAYEIWNSPDAPNFYIPPDTYTNLYTAAQAAVHAVSGSGPVVAGGLGTFVDELHPGQSGSWASQTGVYRVADVVGINVYGFVSQSYCECYTSAGWLDSLKSNWIAFLQSQGNAGAPIWFTESDFTYDAHENNNVDRALGIQDVFSWAKINNIRVFWFHGQDYYNPGQATYSGLYQLNGTPASLSSPVFCGAPQTTEPALYQASAAGLC